MSPTPLAGFSATLTSLVPPCCQSQGGSGGGKAKTSRPLHMLHHLLAAEGCSSLQLMSPLARGEQNCKSSVQERASAEDK